MSVILADEGRVLALIKLLGAISANIKVGLFTAPATPTHATAFLGVTPASFVGYAAQTPAFGAPGLDGNGNGSAAGGTLTFTAGAVVGSQTILGWYLYDVAASLLYFIELFPAPIVINAAGQLITVTPNWYSGQLAPPL